MKRVIMYTFAKLSVLILILLLAGLTTVFAQIRFQDGFEGDFNPDPSNQVYDIWYKSGWQAGGYMAQTTEIVAREGSQCVKAVMAHNTNGKSRTEIGVNLDHSLGHYWYGFSIYIPEEIDLHRVVTDDDDYHCVIAQWGVWKNNPGLPDFALRFAPDEFRITYEPGTDFQYLWDGPMIQGQWVDWVFHIYWTKGNDGVLEVWQNGELVYDKHDFIPTDGEGDDVKSKIGMYYSTWGNHTSDYESIYCYFDAYTIANGLYELGTVAPWANDVPARSEAMSVLPSKFALKQNYPNPFNPSTIIAYQLPTSCSVQLKVFNLPGQVVEILVDAFQSGGYYQVIWQPVDLPSGIYMYQLEAGDYRKMNRLIFVK